MCVPDTVHLVSRTSALICTADTDTVLSLSAYFVPMQADSANNPKHYISLYVILCGRMGRRKVENCYPNTDQVVVLNDKYDVLAATQMYPSPSLTVPSSAKWRPGMFKELPGKTL